MDVACNTAKGPNYLTDLEGIDHLGYLFDNEEKEKF